MPAYFDLNKFKPLLGRCTCLHGWYLQSQYVYYKLIHYSTLRYLASKIQFNYRRCSFPKTAGHMEQEIDNVSFIFNSNLCWSEMLLLFFECLQTQLIQSVSHRIWLVWNKDVMCVALQALVQVSGVSIVESSQLCFVSWALILQQAPSRLSNILLSHLPMQAINLLFLTSLSPVFSETILQLICSAGAYRTSLNKEHTFPDIAYLLLQMTHPWLFFHEITNLYLSEYKKKNEKASSTSALNDVPFTSSPSPTTVDKNTGTF